MAEKEREDMDKMHLPIFMQGEPLPEDYYKPYDPYTLAPSCKVKVGAMSEYARKQGKSCWELTKEEYETFRVS